MGRIKKFFSSISKIITSINSGTSSSPNQLTNRLTLKDQEQIKTLIKNEALTESQIIEQQRQLEIKKKEIDQQILRIEKSTRTSIKQLNMLHNYLRQKYSWYYKWHLFKYSSQVHYAVLASFIAGSVAVSISFFYVANVPNTLASSASYLFSGITNPASATSNKVTVGYNQTPNSPGTEISSDSYGLISALDRSVYGYSESNKPDEMYRFYINNPSTLSSITSLAFSHTGFVRTGNDTQTITASNATANATVTVPTTALGAGGRASYWFNI